MRKLGLIGGMSWVSAQTYLEDINRAVQRRGGHGSAAPLLIESLDFSDYGGLRNGDGWDLLAEDLIGSARRLEQAGAEGLVICANSMHKVYDQVAAPVSIPIIHIADAIGARMARDGVRDAALIGRRNVMTESFFRQRLVASTIDLRAPDMDIVEMIDRVIYDELMVGKTSRDAERSLKTVITLKEQAGAKAIILACAELELVVDVDANVLPIYASTRIHCEAAADWMMAAD